MKKILVVDDDQNMNEFVSRILKTRFQCRVVSVFNAIDAFSFLFRENFDLLLLDISMPLMSGIETLEIIRTDDKLKKLPVAMMTANKEKDTITSIINLGILDYIAKPLTLDGTNKKFTELLKRLPDETESEENLTIFEPNNKIMVIETREEIRKQLENKFSDYDLFITDSGIDGIKYFIKNRPSRVYLGMRIPILNESVLLKAIRKIETEKVTRIVMLRESSKLTMEEQSIINSAVENSSDIESLVQNIVSELKK